jgi:hypothetical protein
VIFRRRDFTEFDENIVNQVLHRDSAAASSPVSVSTAFANVAAGAVDINFLPGHAIRFEVSPNYDSLDRRNYFTNRWLCTWALFAETKRRYPDLLGKCRLWLDDYPHGPGLAFCGNAVSHVLIPDSVFLETDGYAGTRASTAANWWPWVLREEVIFWRGASTGMRGPLHVQHWHGLPRFRLCLLAKKAARQDLFDVRLSRIVQIWDPTELAEIAASGVTGPEVPPMEFLKYRHSIDIDGNTCSWPGLLTKLIMGTTIIKVDSQTGYRQWYYDRLLPWVNFVPLSAGMTELEQIAEWLMTHPEQAFAIGMRGRALADELTTEKVFDDVIPRIRASVQ